MPGVFDTLVAIRDPNNPHLQFSDDEGEDEVCDMLTTDDADNDECPLCKYSQQDASVIDRMNQLEKTMTGTTNSEEIYRTLAGLYEVQVRQPLLNQGLDAPKISVEQIRRHYTLHKLNIQDIVSQEILAINNMQIHFRKNQVATMNSKTGRKKIDPKSMSDWIKLSKHKLELIKYYNGPLNKGQKKEATSIKPYEFS